MSSNFCHSATGEHRVWMHTDAWGQTLPSWILMMLFDSAETRLLPSTLQHCLRLFSGSLRLHTLRAVPLPPFPHSKTFPFISDTSRKVPSCCTSTCQNWLMVDGLLAGESSTMAASYGLEFPIPSTNPFRWLLM